MGEQFKALDDKHIEFIGDQHLFFVGTAAAEGLINVSPKGMDTFRVIDASRVAWLNLTGSGNETAAHVLEHDRMTIMFCSFDKHPRILRLYGKATVVHPRDATWQEHIDRFPKFTGARQVFDVHLNMVQTSCGYAVPYYELKGERPTLTKWADGRGRSGIENYWQERNTESLDQKPTGITEDG
ncbi:MAG: pyridoxamine 5'-phosphate oxidase family protein [Pseudomonadota bacterium]